MGNGAAPQSTRHGSDGVRREDTRALRALLWLKRGIWKAWSGGRSTLRRPCPHEAWIFENPPHMTKARILLARGTAADVRSALEILTALAVVAERNHNIRLQIEIMALRALAFDTQGQTGDARDTLLAAVDLARPGGFVRPFLDLGPRMKDALDATVQAGGFSQPYDGALDPGRVWRPAHWARAGGPGGERCRPDPCARFNRRSESQLAAPG